MKLNSNFKKSLLLKSFVMLAIILPQFFCPQAILCESPKEDKRPWAQIVVNSNDPKALKVLFVGHSKFYINNMPSMFAAMIKIQNPDMPLKVGSVFGSSYSLQEHWTNKLAGIFIKEKGPWDYVVFIARSGNPVTKPKEVEIYLNLFKQEMKVGKMVLTENFSFRKEEYTKIHSATNKLAGKLKCEILPVGTAWNLVQSSNPKIGLFAPDNHHPNIKGTYLMASVCYSFFLNKKSNLKPDALGFKIPGKTGTFNFSKSDVETFHKAAWQAVSSKKENQ